MIIHFFRERTKPRIDFYQLIDGYFDNLSNCSIVSNDDEVEITIDLPEFDFKYTYLITKRSRVSSLYRLNASYININLLCEIPIIVPQYISRIILKQISEICERFELSIYHEKLEDITNFDMFELISSIGNERLEYLKAHPEVKTYKVPMVALNDMCRYQSHVNYLTKLLKVEVIVPKYDMLVDKRTEMVKASISWKAGTPCIFPPQLDYVFIEEEENVVCIVPIEVFYKYTEKMMSEVKDDAIDFKVLHLSEKDAIRAKRCIRKMRKAIVSQSCFEHVKITDLIES